MVDPETNSFDPKGQKSVSLKYFVDLVTLHTANDDLEKDFFIRDIIHLVRSEEVSEEEFEREDFEVRMKMLKTKCSY